MFNNANVNDVTVLNEQELAETKGEFLGALLLGTLIGLVGYAIEGNIDFQYSFDL